MDITAVVAEKGGVGKSTTALDLAVTATSKGKKAAVLDIDPQATASNWTDRRKAEAPWVVPIPAARLSVAIEQARAQGVEFLVIDTPPHSASDSVEAARRADLVLLPIEPHVFSLESLPKLIDLLRLAGTPPAFCVITKAPVQGTDAEQAAQHIKAKGLNVCPHVMRLRAAHRHAGNLGQTALEYEPKGKAAEESLQLYTYTCIQLDSVRSNRVEKELA
jgi:chromosome partitioning protein